MQDQARALSVIPFAVGITGHRDLRPPDVAALRAEVVKIFAGMRRRMPSTPLLLLTGLAEGADQLVAEVALEQNVSVVAVLPMPLDIYRTTMAEPAQTLLEALLARASLQIMLPIGHHTSEELRTNEVARADCYEALAVFLTRHSQALIALWDGKPSDRRGGTAQVVEAVRTGNGRGGVVFHVVTPRLSSSGPISAVATVPLYVDVSGRRQYTQVECHFERFNREALQLAAQPGSHLIEDQSLPLSAFQTRLQSVYLCADAISVRANRLRQAFLLGILVTAVAGTLFYGVHGELLAHNPWIWLSFPSFVVIAATLHTLARLFHVEERYLDARSLAEAIRVQFFWQMAGIKESVAPYYLMHHRTEVDWIRFALANVWLLHQGADEETAMAPRCRVALDHWVRDQEAWFRRKANAQSRIVHRREEISTWALRAAVTWSMLVPFSILAPGPWHNIEPWKNLEQYDWVSAIFHIALAVPALLAGAYRLWIEQSGYQEQAREYRYMENEFAVKANELEAHLDEPEIAGKVLLELGIEALKENGRWLLLHRERPLEVLSSP
jgi:hypothetical protein